MSLQAIAQTLFAGQLYNRMSADAWVADETMKGEKVGLFRRYADGDHRSFLTSEMRKLLRLAAQANNTLTEFNENYMDVVIQTEADRLEVTDFDLMARDDAQTEALEEWAGDLLEDNRFDGMQMDVTEACLRDGVTYLFVDWDKDSGQVRFVHEEAFDGQSGMLVLYDRPRHISAAVKVWYETSSGGTLADTCRVNVYYADRIEKFTSKAGGALSAYIEDGEESNVLPWKMRDGQPIGVPVIPFVNRGNEQGLSEIENAIPLQDALNRTLISMVMTAELTAFQIRYAIGFNPPADITPGSFVKVYVSSNSPDAEQIEWFKSIQIGALEAGSLTGLLEQARYLKDGIGRITRTPAPEFMGGDSASGEALKQREIGLLGKIRRFQVKAGNAWEDALKLARNVQAAFGVELPPEIKRARCRWKDPEIRNDKVTIENAMLVSDKIGDKEFLRLIAPVYGYDEAKIDEILEEREEQSQTQMTRAVNALPGFGQFDGLINAPLNGANESVT